MPDAARWLTADEAARHLRITTDALRRLVRAGHVPPPSTRLGARNPRWDVLALDASMEGGIAFTDPSQAVAAYAEAIAATPSDKNLVTFTGSVIRPLRTKIVVNPAPIVRIRVNRCSACVFIMY